MKFFLVVSIASIVSILASTTAWTIGIKASNEAFFLVLLPLVLFAAWFFLGRWLLYSEKGKPGCLHSLFAFTLSLTFSGIGPFTLHYIADHFDESDVWGIGLGMAFIAIPMLIAAFLSMILMLFLCRPRIARK